jgi:cytochrome P450 family 6
VKSEPILTICDLDVIKTILVKDFHLFTDRSHQRTPDPIISKNMVEMSGDDWKRVRTIVSPTFSSRKMKTMFPKIRDCLTELLNHLEGIAKSVKEMDAKDMYGNYTMDVIASCAFATKTNSFKDPNSPLILNAKLLFNVNPFWHFFSLFAPKFVMKWLISKSPAFNLFYDYIRHTLSQRQQTRDKHNDFVQLLMDADKDSDDNTRDENDVNESHHVNEGMN